MKQFQCQNIMSDDIMTEQLPFPIDQWKESFVEMPVYFHVIFMNETVFAWVGPQSGELKNLHASFPTQQSWVRHFKISFPSFHFLLSLLELVQVLIKFDFGSQLHIYLRNSCLAVCCRAHFLRRPLFTAPLYRITRAKALRQD